MSNLSLRLSTLAILTLAALTAGGCGSRARGPGGPGGSCADLGGTWSISGSCTPSTCVVSQSGCSLSVTCDDGSRLSGSISGANFSGSGSAAGMSLSCSGLLSSGTVDGSCRVPSGAMTCSFSADCTGGPCGRVMTDSGVPTGSGCESARDCAECTAMSTCGWCGEGGCHEGSSSGPDVGSCSLSWAWTSGMCGE